MTINIIIKEILIIIRVWLGLVIFIIRKKYKKYSNKYNNKKNVINGANNENVIELSNVNDDKEDIWKLCEW